MGRSAGTAGFQSASFQKHASPGETGNFDAGRAPLSRRFQSLESGARHRVGLPRRRTAPFDGRAALTSGINTRTISRRERLAEMGELRVASVEIKRAALGGALVYLLKSASPWQRYRLNAEHCALFRRFRYEQMPDARVQRPGSRHRPLHPSPEVIERESGAIGPLY